MIAALVARTKQRVQQIQVRAIDKLRAAAEQLGRKASYLCCASA